MVNDLKILRGAPCWRRTVTLFAYAQAGATLCVDIDMVLVDRVGPVDLTMVNLIGLGAAAAAAIVARGFYPVPKWTDVPPLTSQEAARAAWRAKFSA